MTISGSRLSHTATLGSDAIAALRRGLVFAAATAAILASLGIAGLAVPTDGRSGGTIARLANAPLAGADERLFVGATRVQP